MFYLPRMIHAKSLVFIEEAGPDSADSRYRRLLPVEISQMAAIADHGTRAMRAA